MKMKRLVAICTIFVLVLVSSASLAEAQECCYFNPLAIPFLAVAGLVGAAAAVTTGLAGGPYYGDYYAPGYYGPAYHGYYGPGYYGPGYRSGYYHGPGHYRSGYYGPSPYYRGGYHGHPGYASRYYRGSRGSMGHPTARP